MAKIKGICHNYDNCDKAEQKEIQEVEKTNFVCEECGKPLYPVDDKKQQPKDMRLFILIGCAVIIIAVIVLGVIFGIKAKNKRLIQQKEIEKAKAIQDSIAKAKQDSINAILFAEQQAAIEQAKLDSIAAAAEAEKLKNKAKVTGSIDYGKWSGAWKAGKPHGTGTMKYTKERLIDNRDSQKRVAQPGDYIIGEYANGKLVQGRWYDSSNNLKGSIIIGM